LKEESKKNAAKVLLTAGKRNWKDTAMMTEIGKDLTLAILGPARLK